MNSIREWKGILIKLSLKMKELREKTWNSLRDDDVDEKNHESSNGSRWQSNELKMLDVSWINGQNICDFSNEFNAVEWNGNSDKGCDFGEHAHRIESITKRYEWKQFISIRKAQAFSSSKRPPSVVWRIRKCIEMYRLIRKWLIILFIIVQWINHRNQMLQLLDLLLCHRLINQLWEEYQDLRLVGIIIRHAQSNDITERGMILMDAESVRHAIFYIHRNCDNCNAELRTRFLRANSCWANRAEPK